MKKTIFLLLSIFNFGCNSEKGGMETYSYTKEYDVNQSETISISYPKKWGQKTNLYSKVEFILYEPETDQFRENANLVIDDLSDWENGSYIETSRTQLKNAFNNYTEKSFQKINLNDKNYYKIVYERSQSDQLLTASLYILMKNGRAYNLTCISLSKDYEQYKSTFRDIVKSFKVE